METSRSAIPFLLVLLATACSEGDEPTADLESARSGWRSTELALAEAGIHTGFSGSGMVGPDGVEAELMGTVECPDGGSLTIDAEGEVTDDRTEATLSIAFDGCIADGVTIDGTMTYAGLVTPTEVTAEIHGDLDWSGDAEGTCAIDIEAHVTRDGASVAANSVSGGLCGHAWNEVFGG
jgi:hypothetical protein